MSYPHVCMAAKQHNNYPAMTRRSAATESKKRCNEAHTNNRTMHNTLWEPITRQSDPSYRITGELPFIAGIAGCGHFTRKHTVLRAPASSPNTSPMQPLNAFCNITWQPRMYLRTWQGNSATIMQPLHCDLQPQIPKRPITTHTNNCTVHTL